MKKKNDIDEKIIYADKLIRLAKKEKLELQEKKWGMKLGEKIIYECGDIPAILFIIFASLIMGLSLSYWYLDMTNNIERISTNNMFNLSPSAFLIFVHSAISILFSLIIFIVGMFSYELYAMRYSLRKRIRRKK